MLVEMLGHSLVKTTYMVHSGDTKVTDQRMIKTWSPIKAQPLRSQSSLEFLFLQLDE